MRINTNTAALNSYNQLKNTQDNLSKSLSRLSSGKRINGAADDAAGLAISEKMNSQVKGLGQAQRNAQDGISMIQTAEGALKESHSILQRMRELSVQSANDTNTDADRAEIQKEVDQLSAELTRIGETTEFNTQNLLDGTLDDTKFQIGANEGQNMEVAINDMRADALGVAGDGEGDALVEVNASTLGGTSSNFDLTAGEENQLEVVEFDSTQRVDGQDINYGLKNSSGEIVAVASDNTGTQYDSLSSAVSVEELELNGTINSTDNIKFNESVKSGDVTIDVASDGTFGTGDVKANATIKTQGLETGTYSVSTDTSKGDLANAIEGLDSAAFNGTNSVASDVSQVILDENGKAAAVQLDSSNPNVSANEFYAVEDVDFTVNADDTNEVVDANADAVMTTGNLAAGDKLEIEASGGIDVSSQEAADAAISTLDDAIANVSSERSKLGSVQNRLDHTINNLNTAEENLTAAESRISDVDMAKEMMNMSKQQILSQAGTAMMAQANQLPQGVLQLLG